MLQGIAAVHEGRHCSGTGYRAWLSEAMARLERDVTRSSDTHLRELTLENLGDVQIYLKDESTHPTGSLKHRLARSLFIYGLCSGKIRPGCTVIEASSGSTAVSEAYFARLLDLPFVAIVPRGTSIGKLREIHRYGGRTVEVEAAEIYDVAARMAQETGGHYLDQFTFAERATDWRSNNNIAQSLFEQMAREPHPTPAWVVVGAGTGGTSATIGRYIRYQAERFAQTRVCVGDPENSVFFEGYRSEGAAVSSGGRSRIEGVGRPRMEPSFLPEIIDRMVQVSDAASIATIHWLERLTGRRFGPSTGLNVYTSLSLALEMKAKGEAGSIVSMICDDGARYAETCFDREWLRQEGIELTPHLLELAQFEPASGCAG